jgi:dTMP kinase
MEQGITIVCDRYVESNMGHQGGKIRSRGKRAEFFKWCDDLEYGTLELIRPDVTIFLHMPWEMSYKLIKTRALADGRKLDGHEADTTHLEMAESSYLQLAEIYDWVTIECCNGDLLRSINDIFSEICEKLQV